MKLVDFFEYVEGWKLSNTNSTLKIKSKKNSGKTESLKKKTIFKTNSVYYTNKSLYNWESW